jgi:hypothetical protein
MQLNGNFKRHCFANGQIVQVHLLENLMLVSKLLNCGDKVGAGCPKHQCHKSKGELNKAVGMEFVAGLSMV